MGLLDKHKNNSELQSKFANGRLFDRDNKLFTSIQSEVNSSNYASSSWVGTCFLHKFYIDFIKLTFVANIKSFQQLGLLDLIKII